MLASTDLALDWLTGSVAFVTLLLAGGTFYMAKQTAKAAQAATDEVKASTQAAEAAAKEAQATQELVSEAREDRALGVRPFLIGAGESTSVPGARRGAGLKNIGTGFALEIVVWAWADGWVYRGGCGALASEESTPQALVLEPLGQANTPADPGATVVGADPASNLVAYCVDQLGNRLRFNLRTVDPPEVWYRGAASPDWAGGFA